MGKFCDIHTRNEFADFLKIPRNTLTYILYVKTVDNYYTSFEIPKKSGELRQINAPTNDLKYIQKKLMDALWEYQKSIWRKKGIFPQISHAFEENKSIITNAEVHRNKRFLLNIDLENFFNSFHFGRVRGFFIKNKEFQLANEVATVIAQLTCYKGCLPQGAPSSPIITNLICQILDFRLLRIAKKFKLDYTRYADDLTFSSNNKGFLDKQSVFGETITKEIQNAGFSINNRKTKLQFRDSRQEVTGLIVNKKLNVNRTYSKRTKAMAHHQSTHENFTINESVGTLTQLEGRFAFINQLDCYNNLFEKNRRNFRKLNSREKQYQKFLFYRYFYFNGKPIIVTEGKTDIVYLKAALKKLYGEYPTLISKKSDGHFEFKISFLRRTRRLEYFFGLSLDGADAMKNLYNFFDTKNCDKNNYTNYFSYFFDICPNRPKSPIVFIFDNELQNDKKPLSVFAKHVKLDAAKIPGLTSELRTSLIENGNLYLATMQLVDEKNESEMEDLFQINTLRHKINGKRFSAKDRFDNRYYYGKEIFSQYISSNYKKIDFSGFKGILDNLNDIIEGY